MALLVRTRITMIEPPTLALTVRGKARIRVRGRVCGYVLCAGQRRWAWGAFDQSFQVGRRDGAVRVRAVGLGGAESVTLPFGAGPDLTPPLVPLVLGRLRWIRPRVPAIAPLRAETLRARAGAGNP